MREKKRLLMAMLCAFSMLSNSAAVVVQSKDKKQEPKSTTQQEPGGPNAVFQISEPGSTSHIAIADPGQDIAYAAPQIEFIHNEFSFDGKVVKDVPYSADAVTDTIQTLGDGNRIVRNSSLIAVTAVPVASAALIGYDMPSLVAAPSNHNRHNRPPACQLVDSSSGRPELKPTTITTIGQAYYCILENYFSGPVLDDRSLLVPAFAALTQELQRRGLDQPGATLPALTGKHDGDWAAFSQIYEQINAKLPEDPAVRQAVAEATMRAMVGSLNDNHADWIRSETTSITNPSGIGISGVAGPGPQMDPVASEPLFVTEVSGPAESAGIRPGDEIIAVNGVPPFINGVVSIGVVRWITDIKPGTQVQLTLHRPSTDATFTVTVTSTGGATPGSPQGGGDSMQGGNDSKLVGGNIAYVRAQTFGPGAADNALASIAEFQKNTTLRGVILDLRGNGGGNPEEVATLLGAFAHAKVINYWCGGKEGKDRCRANSTDDSVALLNLPLVALTDRRCASACDSFASAVKDLHLGALVGTRTGGRVSGPAHSYLLGDGSVINLPSDYEIAANKEIVNTIGVAPDYYAPLTAADLSAGRDPGLTKAQQLLQ